jgi:hypothetical protein
LELEFRESWVEGPLLGRRVAIDDPEATGPDASHRVTAVPA